MEIFSHYPKFILFNSVFCSSCRTCTIFPKILSFLIICFIVKLSDHNEWNVKLSVKCIESRPNFSLFFICRCGVTKFRINIVPLAVSSPVLFVNFSLWLRLCSTTVVFAFVLNKLVVIHHFRFIWSKNNFHLLVCRLFFALDSGNLFPYRNINLQ